MSALSHNEVRALCVRLFKARKAEVPALLVAHLAASKEPLDVGSQTGLVAVTFEPGQDGGWDIAVGFIHKDALAKEDQQHINDDVAKYWRKFMCRITVKGREQWPTYRSLV